LVNRDYKFNIPDEQLDLVTINDIKTIPYTVQDNNFRLSERIMHPLDEMMKAYIDEMDENTIIVYSAYRNEATQKKAFDEIEEQYGREEALRRVAQPGHSEHHTGLAVDFSVIVEGVYHSFDYRRYNYHEPTKWYLENSYKFGFVLSFPEPHTDNDVHHITGTIYEPWHYRYVGLPHSEIMFTNNWLLSEYHNEIRQYTYKNPLLFETGGLLYEIYFSADLDVKVPLNVEYDISGNNIDGFIVTIKK